MTDKTSKTSSTARPMTAPELQQGALDAIPDYPEIIAALSIVDERLAALRTPADPVVLDAVTLTGRLLNGEPLPDDPGKVITERQARIEARHHELQLLGQINGELGRRRTTAIRDGADAAFQYLATRLDELVTAGREVLARLGTVRSAQDALDSDDPRRARDDLRELSELAERHEQLREAQLGLISTAAAANGHHPTWAELLTLREQHGLVSNPSEAGASPADPHARWVWLIDSAAVPAVPNYREPLRRADAARPAKPARPATIEGEQEPYLTGPGTDAQRAQRLRTRVGLGPIT